MSHPSAAPASNSPGFTPPHPGSKQMPRWDAAELIDAPAFSWRNWTAFIGPGLVMGAAAIGGGEWLQGPVVTARYGGGLLWLATLSIVGQVFYNLEISRYTLYSGEPIFTGKFRLLPGPMFWLCLYLVLDFGSVFPYLASNAATPVAMMILGRLPDAANDAGDRWLIRGLAYAIFLLGMVPLIFGGKIYNSVKAVMTFKLVTVVGFLLFLAIFYSKADTWREICSGFLKFGTVPIERGEDHNGNGVLDPGEDWDGDGHLDRQEPWKDLNFNGRPDESEFEDTNRDGKLSPGEHWTDKNKNKIPEQEFQDLDGDRRRDGDNLDNVFLALWEGRGFPIINLAIIASLSAMVGVAGSGGLTNTTVSNYTRDQGWGMGHHVGAIPSIIGNRRLELSHTGVVFEVNEKSLARWRRWQKHVFRDQLVVWMPACFIGLALPSMLSVQFLPRGTTADSWNAAGMTAGGVAEAVGTTWGPLFWYLTLFCGFLVLGGSMPVTADGVLRRWVDVFWTGSKRLRRWDPAHIGRLYFMVLCCYATFGMVSLTFFDPKSLIEVATLFYNYALGFSCWHTIGVNMILLPKEIRPGWFVRIAMFLAGAFFLAMALLATVQLLRKYELLG